MKSEKLAAISIEQRNEFLKGKFSEEEISEIHKRLKEDKREAGKPAASSSPAPTAATAQPTIYNSPQGQQRLQQTNSHFLTTAINVASLAIVSSVSVTYLLDTFKEKRDESLRNELKDRLYSTLSENTNRLRQLEIKQDQLEHKLVEPTEVESIINKRFEQYENGLTAQDVRNKTINLKVRAQPN